MAEYLTKHFVDLRSPGLTFQTAAELCLDHAESGFDIRAFMIAVHKRFTIKAIIVIHLFEHACARSLSIHFERDVRRPAELCNQIMVVYARICFICRYFIDLEILGRLFNQRRKLRRIAHPAISDLYRRNNISFHACHKVAFNPLMLRHLFAVLHVKPSDIVASAKSRRINREVCFDCAEWKAGSCDESLQDRRECLHLKIVVNAVEVTGFGDVTLCCGLFQVAPESSTRHARIDLEDRAENYIAQRQWLSALLMMLHRQAQTEVTKQILKQGFLVSLCLVVGFPILRITDALSDFQALGYGRGSNVAIGCMSNPTLALNREFNSKQMLAFDTSQLMVWTITKLFIQIDRILSVTRLTGYTPFTISLGDVKSSCYFKSSLLSRVHRVFSFLGKHTAEAYNLGCLGHIASAVWLKAPVGVDAPTGVFTRLGGGWIRTSESTGCHPVAVSHFSTPPQSFLFILFTFRHTFLSYKQINNRLSGSLSHAMS